jgi:hypothetical protein
MSDEATYRPRCKFLSGKSLLVYGEAFEADPEYQGGSAEFCCACTCTGQGPDGGAVSLEGCCDPARDCYQEY